MGLVLLVLCLGGVPALLYLHNKRLMRQAAPLAYAPLDPRPTWLKWLRRIVISVITLLGLCVIFVIYVAVLGFANEHRLARVRGMVEPPLREALAVYAVEHPETPYPLALPTWDAIVQFVNNHGGTLKNQAREMGVAEATYTSNGQHYCFTLVLAEVPANFRGHLLEITPEGSSTHSAAGSIGESRQKARPQSVP